MANTKIEWATKVWNPVTGCVKVSQGCKNCYAETYAKRFWGSRKFTEVRCHEDKLSIPLRWKKPQNIFVNSMSDLFHEDVPLEFIAKVFAIMYLNWCDFTPELKHAAHNFMILTKRPERLKMLVDDTFFEHVADYANEYHDRFIRQLSGTLHLNDEVASCFPLENVWLGVSTEDQNTFDERRFFLDQVPAVVKFISFEPLLGPIKFDFSEVGKFNWAICGGESGKNARPVHPDWVRSLRDQCAEHNIPFFFKQWGEYAPFLFDDVDQTDFDSLIKVGKKKAGRLLDGIEHNELPGDRC